MTDKQTIIDRVDVSGCEYLYTDNRYNDKCCSASISGDSLCKPSEMICVKYVEYLKEQLKHKEQECEELKKTIMYKCPQCGEVYLSPIGASLYEENKKLKQTLAEIKEITEPYKMTIKKICGNCKKYDDCHACCYKDINCYKYTSSKTDACEEFTYLDEFIPNLLANNILQKISECETENE